jgi:hypothetical protein
LASLRPVCRAWMQLERERNRRESQNSYRGVECHARVGSGFLSPPIGFFFFTATLLPSLALGLAFVFVTAFFFRVVFLAPLVAFLAVAFFFEVALTAAAAAVGANETRAVPAWKVRRVWKDSKLGVVAMRARVTPRTRDDVPRREVMR